MAFNAIGTEHTVTFVCDRLVASLGAAPGTPATGGTLPAGCYNVSIQVTDLVTSSPGTITDATCGGVTAAHPSGSVDCSGVSSPICPVGSVPAAAPGPTTPCALAPTGSTGYLSANTATVTINPGAPHPYTITVSGYIPTSALGSCPVGTTLTPGITLTTSFGGPPESTVTPTAGACRFTVTANKKYVEITNVQLTGGPCGGTLYWAEGLKAFFGPACTVTATATGTVVIKTGVNCALEPANGSAAPSEFPSVPGATAATQAQYSCSFGNLSVINVYVPNVPVQYTVTGPGSFNVLNNLGSSCSGVIGASNMNSVTGMAVTFCPTGPGAGSIAACVTTGPNNQPTPICSNAINFTFTQFARRVVPYVRWAGEKIALTKCFGPALGNSPVEFVLKGSNPGLDATLLPTDLASTLGTGAFPSQNTIWTVTDQNGCASVLGYADGEGVMYVDAAIFNTSGPGLAAGAPIVNEHAFEVFYLKFDHLDLENINSTSVYSRSTALDPYLSFFAGTPAVHGATFFPSSFTLPSAPGTNQQVAGPTGYSVPICQVQFLRSMVHGYFEIPGDPSGRPATSVAIPGAPLSSGGTPSAGSYVLPAGRWVLPEDWPVLATFAGFSPSGAPNGNFTPSSVLAWDLNSGWVFNPAGENPVLCTGTLQAPDAEANGTGEGALFSNGDGGFGNISAGATDRGPCFSQDGNGTFYSTAGPGYNNLCGQLSNKTAQTVGIGPFDALQSCTDPFPLAYTPSGASLIGNAGLGTPACPPNAPAGPCIVPAGLNSTYLPNGTLNQWDAPMPPAQISFGITSGPGYLDEVNKTGLYSLILDAGAPTSSGACPTGYTISTVTGYCHLDVNPNPFYSEAIPASPFIPPITNNGGYLWNSWNFSAGTVTTVSATNPFGAPAGGFVPGQSTSVTIPVGLLPTEGCPTSYFTTFNSSAGTCTVPGGINVTTCSTPSGGSTTSIVVADGRGFIPGMSVEVYSASNGTTTVGASGSGPVIQAVLPAPQPANSSTGTPAFPNAVELVFSSSDANIASLCAGITGPFQRVFIAQQFGLPVSSVAPFLAQGSNGTCAGTLTIGNVSTGGQITLQAGANSLSVVLCDPTANIVYVSNTSFVAAAFGPCATTNVGSGISRAGGPSGNAFCEPNLLVAAGTLLETGPKAAGGIGNVIGGTPANPYPFWQWVPAAPGAAALPTSGTVYSDNHGEAVVSLNTGLAGAFQILPVNGACPKPYFPISYNGTVAFCQLPFSVLGTLGFANVATALKSFSASKPGCIQTYPSGTFAVLPNATVGATGPATGQICINSLGGIEFGASATLGATTVQAIADYPYTRGEHPPIASAGLTKVWQSLFAKTLTVSPPSAAPANTTSFTVTVTAKDVCGNPLVGEPVELYVLGNAGAAVLAPVSAASVLNASTNSAVVTVSPNTGQATLSLEVLNTAIGTQGLVVKAVFPAEGIERFVTVIPGSTTGQFVNQPYGPGWQMVGGPAGSNFSVSEALFAWDPVAAQYVNSSASAGQLSSAAPGCTGYWAYFAAAMVVQIPASSTSGQTAACTLKAGWNLVGNPFATPAALPSGTTAYYWNGTSYDTVGRIPVGGSVWIYNDGTLNSLTLTAT